MLSRVTHDMEKIMNNLTVLSMNECLMVNQRKNYLENKSAMVDLKTRNFLIKSSESSDHVKFILICNLPRLICNELEFYDKLSYINGKILTVVKCNTHFRVISVHNLSIDCQITYGLYKKSWGKRERSRIIRNSSIKTKESQPIQLSGVVLLSRHNPVFDTVLPIPSPSLEVPYPCPCLTSDAPSSQPGPALEVTYPRPRLTSDSPSPQPDPAPQSQQPSNISLPVTASSMYNELIQSSTHLPVAIRNSIATRTVIEDDDDDDDYSPFKHRCVPHPTTDFETLIHLMKGSLGTGILAMAAAFKDAGLFFGLFATFFVGFVCVHSIYILVKCSHILCKKMKVPSLGFDDIAEVAFFAGPPSTRKFATFARFIVNLFLVLDLVGCCCVYIVFVARNAKQVIDVNIGRELDVRLYMVALLPFLISINLIPHLKYLAPFSLVANMLMATGVGITFYYVFHDLPPVTSRPKFSSIEQLPVFFGTAIFALEGIGVVMPLENNMKNPQHFTGCPGVLNIGMCFVVLLYSSVGFFGYLKYGAATEASITLNLPDHILAQSVKVMIAVAIFLTYSLQFHVPLVIIWKGIKHKFPNNLILGESILRITLVVTTVAIAIMVPHLGPFISLVGAVCLSFLGLMFPAIVEIVVCCGLGENLGTAYWILWKNLAIIMFGIVGFFTGSYTSILEIIEEHKKMSNM